MDFLHTGIIQPSGNDYSDAIVAKSDAPDGLLSNIVRVGVAGVCGATSAMLDECFGGASNAAEVNGGNNYGRGEPESVKQPKYKRQVGDAGAAAGSTKRSKSEKAGTGKRAKET